MFLYRHVSKLDSTWDKLDGYVKRLPSGIQGFIGGFVGIGVDHVMFGPPGDNLLVYTLGGGELYPGSFAKWLLSYYSAPIDSILQLSVKHTSQWIPLAIDKVSVLPYIGSHLSYNLQNFQILVDRLFQLL